MKKYIIGLCTVLLLVTGCGSKKETINLQKVEENLSLLKVDIDNQQREMFKSNQTMSTETLKDKYGITTENMEEFLISMPTLLESANMYMVVKPKKGEMDKAKQQTEQLMKKYEAQWSLGYAPKEENKVKNRSVEEYSGYLIYIISDDNNKVLETIKNSK